MAEEEAIRPKRLPAASARSVASKERHPRPANIAKGALLKVYSMRHMESRADRRECQLPREQTCGKRRQTDVHDPMYGPAVRCKRVHREVGCGLASMYPAFDWSSSCSRPSWISVRVRSH
jgi:hypothetical protein